MKVLLLPTTSLQLLLLAISLPVVSSQDPYLLRRRKQQQTTFDQDTSIMQNFNTNGADGEDSDVHIPFQSRIVGGTNADVTKFPFFVELGGCGGSLIHEDIVLTAAHCRPLYPEVARIGGSNKLTGIRREISGTGTRHPSYSTSSQRYDFMVYKLKTPITELDPVVLNKDGDSPENDETLTVIGFGSTYEGGPGSFNLQQANVNKVSHSVCNWAYRGQVNPDIMFCAGVDGGGVDSCQGDSGGPILNQDGVQVGVTSWGNGCAQRGFPGVYARVSAISDWLQEQVCMQSENPPASCTSGNNNDESNNNQEDEDVEAELDDNGDEEEDGSNADNEGKPDDNEDSEVDGENGDAEEEVEENPDLWMVQPKGVSIRVDVNYDEYPQENAWVLYNDDTKEEIHYSDYGAVTSPGLKSMTFTDLPPATYVFLLLDEFWDGICCRYGNGFVKIYESFPPELDREDELRWSHNGRFWNAAGASFRIYDEVSDTRSVGSAAIEVLDDDFNGDSPYLH